MRIDSGYQRIILIAALIWLICCVEPACAWHRPEAPTNRHLTWSPDGSKIVFDSNVMGEGDDWTWELDLNTGKLRQLLQFGVGGGIVWSPDWSKVAYSNGFICVMNPDGTGKKQLTFLGEDVYPVWSPDKKKILYDSTANSNLGATWVINSDGTGNKSFGRFRYEDPVQTGLHYRWSPDGEKIVFESSNVEDRGLSYDDSYRHIYIMNSDGTELRQITQGNHRDCNPEWYPDGSRISFVSYTRSPSDLWSVKPDGTDLTFISEGVSMNYCWSSDGSQIAFIFAQDDPTGETTGFGNIAIINADGTGFRQVTEINEFIPDCYPAQIDIDPDTINLKSHGKWITCYIELPKSAYYEISDIILDTTLLNNKVPPETSTQYGFVTNPEFKDRDEDGLLEYMVKFDREKVQAILPQSGTVRLSVTGKVNLDMFTMKVKFKGTDVVRVISQEKPEEKQPKKGKDKGKK